MATKKCTKCREEKPLEEFHRQAGAEDGRRWQCKSCVKTASRVYYGHNVAAVHAATTKWQRANPQALAKIQRRAHLKRAYGLTEEDYESMAAKQRGMCAVCRKPETAKWGKLAVDHNHKTGKVRALLCNRCNQSLGQMREDPKLMRKLAEYVETHNEEPDPCRST